METLRKAGSWCAEQAGDGIVWSIKQFGKGLVWLFENTIGLLITEAFGILTNKYGIGWTMFVWGCIAFLYGFHIGGQDGQNIIAIGTCGIMGAILYAFKKF